MRLSIKALLVILIGFLAIRVNAQGLMPIAPTEDSGAPLGIILWVMAAMALLKALSDFLSFVSRKTKNNTDDKIALFMASILSFLSKIIDYVTANTRPGNGTNLLTKNKL